MLKIEGIPSSGLVSFLESGAIMSNNDERISHQSLDLGEFNKERLLEMFPIFRTEGGGVDFDRLKLVLGESVEVGKEVFGMRWPGKADSIRLANAPSHGTLSPDEKESVNFDTTQNLIIEGDNLEVLKLLQKSYQGKVKMIYIDPPYNTGNDFVYEDDFSDGIKNYLRQTGQIDDEGNRLSTNSETDGRFHSNWMNMIYPRLILANNILSEDGIIFISIDDNEQDNLKKICNEVFGESNFIGQFVWKKGGTGKNDSVFAVVEHEYIFAYARNSNSTSFGIDPMATVSTSYNRSDDKGEYSLVRLDSKTLGYVETLDFEIVDSKGNVYMPEQPDGKRKVARWRWGKDTVENRYSELVFENGFVYTKNYKKEGARPRSILADERFGVTRTGRAEAEAALGESGVFDFPKPVRLIQHLTRIIDDKDALILDFFAGSGTTAQACMEQNIEDGGSRRFILVQLPARTAPDSEASKAGFDSIFNITCRRVSGAGRRIIERLGKQLDIERDIAFDAGFRVLRLAESNIEDWNSEEASKSPKDLLDALKTTRLKSGRSEQDVVFEVLVKFGVELTSTLEEQKVGKGSVWKIAGGELIVVVSPGLTNADLNVIVKMSPKVVVMLDEAFVPEALKTNARAIFKDAKIELKTF